MQKITPFLWFENNAEEAVKFYTSIFNNSKELVSDKYSESGAEVSGMPKDSVMSIEFELEGLQFVALNGGPFAKFTPAVSFMVSSESAEETEALWKKLLPEAKVMMEFDKYPFSEKYGWLEDKYGVSWQLFTGPYTQKITPSLMFVGDKHGKVDEAIKFYTEVFKNSKINNISRYPAGGDEPEGTVMYSNFTLEGFDFMAMENSANHQFTITSAISFIINCENQKEVDHYWETLSEGGEQIQCGWLTDKYGVAWQVVPTILNDLMRDPDQKKAENVTKAMLKMKKLIIADLKNAYDQE